MIFLIENAIEVIKYEAWQYSNTVISCWITS